MPLTSTRSNLNSLTINLDQKGVKKMEDPKKIINLVLKAVAVGMSVASIVMGFLPDAADVDTHITLLSIGLAALAVAALQKEE
jgi:putative Mn2+ efflux pump MntP